MLYGSLDWREIVGAGGNAEGTTANWLTPPCKGVASDTAVTDADEEQHQLEMVEFHLWPPVPADTMKAR